MVEDGDLPAEDEPKPAKPPKGKPAPADVEEPAQPPDDGEPETPPPPKKVKVDKKAEEKKKAEEETAKAARKDQKPLKPGETVTPPEELARLAKPIIPVAASQKSLREHWEARRQALREQDAKRAREEEQKILAEKKELSLENLPALAAALGRESERAIAANVAPEAVARAELAVQLAPDLPAAHLWLARAHFARDWSGVKAVGGALMGAAKAAGRDPFTRRAMLGDLIGALLAGIFAAACLAVLVFFLRNARLSLHDFHHLFPSGASPAQTGLLALVLLCLPMVLNLGLFAVVAVALAASWLYLTAAEKVIASIALAAFAALPYGAMGASRLTELSGTLAAEVQEIEHGADAADATGRLAAQVAAGEKLPPLALVAVGRSLKRRGDLDGAQKVLARAIELDPRVPESHLNLGNVLLLKGDPDGAKTAYLAAVDRSTSNVAVLAAAHFDLSKVFYRQAALDKGQEARRKAVTEDPGLADRVAAEDDLHANAYLVDAVLTAEQIESINAASTRPEAVAEQVRARLGGAVPAGGWPWVPAGFLAVLWLVSLFSARIVPASACVKCGRPVCRRCDGVGGGLCGQCVNVFVKKGVVDARDRLRKEVQVRQHAKRTLLLTRALAIIGGGIGHLAAGGAVRGFLFLAGMLACLFALWFAPGVLPAPLPSPWSGTLEAAVAIPVLVVLYALSLRRAFREED
jgi:tetratricopeptide (TPR) repeat protein